MDELQQVLTAARDQDRQDRRWALATIVAVSGSTYRRAGARLVVRDDNTWIGNLSGGCLEGEVLELGGAAIDDGRPRRDFYDLTADEEAIWGWGLGCNGAMDVFVAPDRVARRHLDLLERGRGTGAPFCLATIIADGSDGDAGPEGPQVGATALLTADGAVDGAEEVGDDVVAAARLTDGTTVLEVGDREVFVEHAGPPLRVLVCGAGHDAIPVVARGASLGWDMVVVDDRASFLDEARFPEAAGFVHADPGDAAEATDAGPRDAAVVMSHNFLRDAEYLASLAPVGLSYLGMLGPGARLERLVDHLLDRGTDVRDHLGAVHGPAGLDLGAEGPDEIALCIVAEVLAVQRDREAGFLRDRGGPIHRPEDG